MGINQISVFQISMSSRNSYVEILPKPQADPWTMWVWVVRAHLYVDFFFSTNMCAVLQHDTISACFNPKCRTADTESWLGSYTRIVQGSVPLILEFCSSRVNLIRRWASESAWRRKWQRTPVFLLENSVDGGAWQAAVHGVAKSWTRLSDWAHTAKRSEVLIHTPIGVNLEDIMLSEKKPGTKGHLLYDPMCRKHPE